jgi:hypothetical protein
MLKLEIRNLHPIQSVIFHSSLVNFCKSIGASGHYSHVSLVGDARS